MPSLKLKLFGEDLTGQDTSGASAAFVDVSGHEDFVAEVVVASGTGTLDVEFEDSADGVNFDTWFALPQATGAAAVLRAVPTRPPLGFVRRKQTIAGGGTWAYVVRLVGEVRQ